METNLNSNSGFLERSATRPELQPELRSDLSPENQRERFARNRVHILKIASWLLRPVTFSQSKFDERMAAIDAFIIKSSDAIVGSNRTGVVISFSLSLGLGLSDKLLSRISSSRVRSWIPESGGFYYVVSGGFGFYLHEKPRARRRLVLEFFSDFDSLDTVHTYAAEGSVAVNWGVAVDRAAAPGIAKMNSHYIGILGVVRQSPEHFSYSLITGLAFPPYFPVGMVYTNQTSRAHFALPGLPLYFIG